MDDGDDDTDDDTDDDNDHKAILLLVVLLLVLAFLVTSPGLVLVPVRFQSGPVLVRFRFTSGSGLVPVWPASGPVRFWSSISSFALRRKIPEQPVSVIAYYLRYVQSFRKQ